MGPLKVAKLNGLSVSRQPVQDEAKDDPEHASNDERVRHSSGDLVFRGHNINFQSKCKVWVRHC